MRATLSFDDVPAAVPDALRVALETGTAVWSEALGASLVSLVLFGSVARGDARPSSDIDLLVVADDLPRSLTDRARPLRQMWDRVRRDRDLPAVDWDLVVKTPEEAVYHSPLYLDIVEDGILLVDRDAFFRSVLDAMRTRMRELGSRRVMLPDGSWYWDLKPDYRFGEVVEI